MFGLIKTTSMPSSLRALMAWEPARRARRDRRGDGVVATACS
jgi:hypothetical protein